ncbi:YkyA family protein [Alkalihalobacillus sp. 1P02AB]|uniref:YkyA family protein n=1 Tax=Alkalihalobacillus sp. 1P02AB TaxID=3132260 RepID=UPI0039A5494B
MSVKKRWYVTLSLLMMLVLVACGKNVAEDVFVHLEQAVELESTFKQQQEILKAAENNEQQLYEEVIDLGMDEFELILSLTEEALASIETRENAVALEKESIEQSYEEFQKVEAFENEINEGEGFEHYQTLREKMKARYESYQDLHTAYVKSINLDRELFELLQREDFELVELQEKIEEVNESYSNINETRDVFNQFTVEYNESKQAYYSSADLNWKLNE